MGVMLFEIPLEDALYSCLFVGQYSQADSSKLDDHAPHTHTLDEAWVGGNLDFMTIPPLHPYDCGVMSTHIITGVACHCCQHTNRV